MKKEKQKIGEDVLFLLVFPAVWFFLCYVCYFYRVVNFELAAILFALLLGVTVSAHASRT